MRIKAWHGLGSVTYGVKEAGLTTFFMIYYNQVLGFDPRLISLVLIGAMVVDAIADPLIGRLSDATQSRFGRRLPWLYLSALPMAVAWVLLWLPESMVPHNFWTLLLNVVAVRVLVSACEIPSIALVAELTRDYDDRTTLMRFRFLFGWIGGLITTALAYGYFLKSADGSGNGILDPDGYAAFGLFGGAMILLTTTLSALGQHRAVLAMPPATTGTGHSTSLIADIMTALRHPAFVALAAGAAFLFCGYATAIASLNYTALYVWRFSDAQLAYFPIVLVISVLAAFAATGAAHRRLGKRDTAMRFIAISGLLWIIPYAARNFGLWPALGGTASMLMLMTLMTAALFCHIVANISAASMVAEIVEAHEAEAGTRNEGVFFAGYFMVNKIGNAAGIFMVGQIMALVGLSDKVDPAAFSPATADALAWTLGLVLAGLAFGSAFGLRGYAITRADHDARVAALAVREGAENAGPD